MLLFSTVQCLKVIPDKEKYRHALYYAPNCSLSWLRCSIYLCILQEEVQGYNSDGTWCSALADTPSLVLVRAACERFMGMPNVECLPESLRLTQVKGQLSECVGRGPEGGQWRRGGCG